MAIRAAFTLGVEVAGADRLMTIHKVSLIQLLPKSYAERIRAFEGVTDVSHANWFGAYYQEPSNFLANMAVDPESWLRMYPEFQLPEDQAEGVDCRPHRRDRRHRHGEEVQVEGRRPRAADFPDLPEAGRLPLGIHHRRHLRLAGQGHRQDAVLLPLGLHQRDVPRAGRHRGSGRLVRHPGRRIRRAPTASPRGSTRSSRTRRPRPRRRPRRRSSRTSPARSATSAAS